MKVSEILDTVISAGGLIPVVKHTSFLSTRVVSYTIKPGETHCKIISGDHPVSRDRFSNKSTKTANTSQWGLKGLEGWSHCVRETLIFLPELLSVNPEITELTEIQ